MTAFQSKGMTFAVLSAYEPEALQQQIGETIRASTSFIETETGYTPYCEVQGTNAPHGKFAAIVVCGVPYGPED